MNMYNGINMDVGVVCIINYNRFVSMLLHTIYGIMLDKLLLRK